MYVSSALTERAIGKYPLSIATSLAMEALTGTNDEINESRKVQPTLREIPLLWVNVLTLIRNLMGAMPRDGALGISPDELAEVCVQEMAIIKDVAEQHTSFRARVVFYASEYDKMDRQYPHAVLRSPTTNLQQITFSIINDAMKMVVEQTKLSATPVEVYKLKLTPKVPQPKAFILTHYAFDLLSYRSFEMLHLIESHTGRVKLRSMWYTKYYNGKELVMIPFREDFLQIFGDNEHFRPLPISLRKEIIEVATQDRWTYMTTSDKIKNSISKIKDHYARELIRQILV